MRSLASLKISSNLLVSSSGAISGTGLVSSLRSFIDEEGIDQVEERVVDADAVVNADEQNVALFGRCFDAHVQHVDARFPARQRALHAVPHYAPERRCIGLKGEFVHAAAEPGAHLPFSHRGAHEDPNALPDLLLAGEPGEPPGAVRLDRKCPPLSKGRLIHISLRSSPCSRQPPSLRGRRPGHCRSARYRPRAPRPCY